MKISVVIPAYNEEKYLPDTLESVKKLDRKPEETVIVDGGSTDSTVNIAKKAGAITLVVPHRGIGYARQQGLLAASGDIVAFTDADTILPHDWLNKIEEALSLPNVSGVYGGYKVTYTWWVYGFCVNYLNPIILELAEFVGRPIPGGQNIAFLKQKGIAAGGFPVDFKSVEDFEMMRRLKKVGRVIYLRHNYVISSGRRGKEGWPMIFRVGKGIMKYFLSGKADTFYFPDIR